MGASEAQRHPVTLSHQPLCQWAPTQDKSHAAHAVKHTQFQSLRHIHPKTNTQIHMNTYKSIVSHNHHFDFCCLSTGLGGIWRSPFFANCCNKSFFFKQIVLQDHFLQIVVKDHLFLQTVKCPIGVPEHFLHKVILGHFFAKKILIFIKLSFPISISANCRTWTLFASCCAWLPPIQNYIIPLLRL